MKIVKIEGQLIEFNKAKEFKPKTRMLLIDNRVKAVLFVTTKKTVKVLAELDHNYEIGDDIKITDGVNKLSTLVKDPYGKEIKYTTEIFKNTNVINDTVVDNQQQLESGYIAIDNAYPFVYGMKMLIVGGESVGKSVLSQKILSYQHFIRQQNKGDLDMRIHNIYLHLGDDTQLDDREYIDDYVYTPTHDLYKNYMLPYEVMALAENYSAGMYKVNVIIDSMSTFLKTYGIISSKLGLPTTSNNTPLDTFTTVAGMLQNVRNRVGAGAITTFLTIGDEPEILNSMKSITDGHISLVNDKARAHVFPAIDFRSSVSRMMPEGIINRLQSDLVYSGASYAKGSRLEKVATTIKLLSQPGSEQFDKITQNLLLDLVDYGFTDVENIKKLLFVIRDFETPISTIYKNIANEMPMDVDYVKQILSDIITQLLAMNKEKIMTAQNKLNPSIKITKWKPDKNKYKVSVETANEILKALEIAKEKNTV